MRRSKREAAAAIERIEAVACTSIGDEERELMLRPNDLRRVVDHFDDTRDSDARLRAEVRRLKAAATLAREAIRKSLVRYNYKDEPALLEGFDELGAALKPRRKVKP